MKMKKTEPAAHPKFYYVDPPLGLVTHTYSKKKTTIQREGARNLN